MNMDSINCYFLSLAILTTCISSCLGDGCNQPLSCNVSKPCDCCLDGKCAHGSEFCGTSTCKNGYWGGKCINNCPKECKCCDRNYEMVKQCAECLPGYYGDNCNINCSKGCQICDKGSGTCQKCDHGHYGSTCNMTCSTNCQNSSCDTITGACDICVEGFYATYCDQLCPPNCQSNGCDKTTGVCISCDSGYFGNFCNDQCPEKCFPKYCDRNNGNCVGCEDGYHGLKCNDSCPEFCKNKSCNIYYANCTHGCVSNIEGEFCDSCITGKYGGTCKNNCSQNCTGNKCQRDDGACSNGCKYGFSDSKFCCASNLNCEKCLSYTNCTSCVNGTYGKQCNDNCSVNCNGPCEKSTGQCLKCYLNHYGLMCEHTCSSSCIPASDNKTTNCHQNNGSCIYGCKSGSYGYTCDSTCSLSCNISCERVGGKCDSCKDNTFGIHCEDDCSANCLRRDDLIHLCFRDNGSCIYGCESGFFGSDCTKSCSEFCKEACNRETGQCQRGCELDHFGPFCENTCNDGCAHGTPGMSRCYETNGTCFFGCKDGYFGDTCKSPLTAKKESEDDTFPIATVAAAVAAGIVVAVLAVVICVVIQKRSRLKQYTDLSDKSKPGPKYGNMVFDGSHPEEEELDEGPPLSVTQPEDENPYANQERPKTKLSKQNLMKFLSKSNEDYKQEFEFLPSGLIKSFTEATKSGNAHKNRYKRIYPYDDSRVKVVEADSDYINASYISGYKNKRAYIAAQGPTTKNMGADFAIFWKMVWQEKVETIVMVTKLHELTGSKCDQYWPNVNMRSKYAEFEVNCAKEEVFAEFVVRSLTIKKGKDTRHINHVNFTAWPDKGVPHDVISIINLRHKVDKMKKMFKESPLLVHCSAGVGRTGTYIALDILTHQGYGENEIDVFECVVDMRQNRTTMVQTLEQYKFLHHAVLWTLTSDIDPLPSERFVDRSWLNDHKLADMFNQLQIPNFYDNEEERLSIADNKKIPFTNRPGADIPGRRHGVSLMMNEMANKSSYINAVYIDGYKTKERFIAAMTPLPDTVFDFLGMLLQENVTCVVDLTPLDSDQQDIGEYLPADNQDIENESHVFRITAREVQGCFLKREVEISKKKKGKKGDSKTLHHFQFTNWNANAPLPHSADLVTLVNAVDTATIKMDITGPIVVHCLSGAKRSGLFCAVWLLIERMTIDRAVSVLNTLRQVKTRRRGAIPNKEQIGFCFECVDHHLKYLSERVYSNTELQTGGREMAQV